MKRRSLLKGLLAAPAALALPAVTTLAAPVAEPPVLGSVPAVASWIEKPKLSLQQINQMVSSRLISLDTARGEDYLNLHSPFSPESIDPTPAYVHKAIYPYDQSRRYIYQDLSLMSPDEVPILKLIGIEGDPIDSPTHEWFDSTNPVKLGYNRVQAFDTSYKIMFDPTDPKYDYIGWPDRERSLAFTEMCIRLESAVLRGRRSAVDAGHVGVPSTMGGLDYYLTGGLGPNSVSYTDWQGEDLTEKRLNQFFEGLYQKVGYLGMPQTLLMGPWNKRRISDLFWQSGRTTRQEPVNGVTIDRIQTDWGNFDIVLSWRMPKDRVYAVNLLDLSIHPYRNLAFFDQEEVNSYAGAWEARQLYGVYTLRVKNPERMGAIINTRTS